MVVTGVIVIVILVVLALVSGLNATAITVADAKSGSYSEKKVEVSGKVVDNSFSTTGNVLVFSIYDEKTGPDTQLVVSYDKGIAATFGNGIEAICTGTINAEGVLICTELVTKCPSKYESGYSAISVSQLLGYGDDIVDTLVQVTGEVKPGTLKPAGQGIRFVLVDSETAEELSVLFNGALSDEIQDGTSLVVTGSLNASGELDAGLGGEDPVKLLKVG
jgi:cytochrome c-type biogenesis protein CcmE